jgi:hypothetical protein
MTVLPAVAELAQRQHATTTFRFDLGIGTPTGATELRRPGAHVAVLLSTYNGARFLREHLTSLVAQEHANWTLYWRDDGSADESVSIVNEFAAQLGSGRCIALDDRYGHLGATGSFLALLRAVLPTLGEQDIVAFADQDDVWLPHKLGAGVAALLLDVNGAPALYCARQILVDATLRPLGLSDLLLRPTGFPAALAQNVATGCTVMLNHRGVELVAASRPAVTLIHDWWCYLLITAAGGRVLHDEEPVVLYRQHGGNLIGAPASMLRRGVAALRRGPAMFMAMLRQHVAALEAHQYLLTATARGQLTVIDRALRGGMLARLRAIRMPGLHRQTWLQTVVFRCWFLLG